MLNEVKITEEQFNHLESIRYDLPQKFLYVKKILNPKYQITEDTVFVTYKDTRHFYLVFESEIVEADKKYSLSSISEKSKEI